MSEIGKEQEYLNRMMAPPTAHPADSAEALLREALEHARKFANRIYEQREWSEADLLEIIHAADDALAAPQTRQPAYGADGLGLPAMMRPRAAAEGSEPLDVERLARALEVVFVEKWPKVGRVPDVPVTVFGGYAEDIAAAYASQTSEPIPGLGLFTNKPEPKP